MATRYLLLAAVVLAATAASAQPADASSPARAFVTQLYFESIPFVEARALGKDALPDLYAVLDDPALEPYWANTVVTIGYIGSPESVGPLMDHLYGLEGDVSVNAFRSALRVFPALGLLHGAGSAEALGPLVAFSDDTHWQTAGLAFRYGRYEGAALGEVLGRTAVMGLGWSGTPEAAARLDALRADLRPDWTDNVDEATTFNARVRVEGVEAMFAPPGL